MLSHEDLKINRPIPVSMGPKKALPADELSKRIKDIHGK
jgi:hypothetical protein